MALETATYISDLNSSNPSSTDSVAQADDHLRLIKSAVKATFPNVTGAVTKTHSQINNLLEKAGGTMTGALTLSGAPTVDLHASTKKYVDDSVATKVAPTRSISAGTGLTGGGDLSADRTISVASGGITATQLASDAVTTVKILDANVTPSKLSQPLTLSTSQATTSGQVKEFLSIPSWVKRITVMFNGVSTNGTSSVIVQVGSGSYTTSGYIGATVIVGGGGAASANLSTGFRTFFNTSDTSSAVRHGHIILTNITGNTWTASGTIGLSDGPWTCSIGGNIALSGVLDRLRVTTVNGTDSFDAGSVNILYE